MTTNTFNATALESEKISACEHIYNTYHNKGGKLEINIHKTSSSNLTWRYSVRLWYVSDKGLVESLYLNYYLSLLGFGKLNKDGLLTGNGVGIERSFQVAYQLGNALANYGFTDPSLESSRQGYQLDRYMLGSY